MNIYEHIHNWSLAYHELHPDCPVIEIPTTYQEADDMLAYAIVYYGIRITNRNGWWFTANPIHNAIRHLLKKYSIISYSIYPVWSNPLKAAADKKSKYHSIINKIHNLRQRYWYWNMFDIEQVN